jgi:predicted small lipoprotein YifL
MTRLYLSLAALLALTACGDDDPLHPPPPPVVKEPLFPANFAQVYEQVRECRASSEHDLSRVLIYADALARTTYQTREGEFAVGSTIVKEEYDGTDTDCSGPLTQWTVMQRLAAGSSPATLDWTWQRISRTREVLTENELRCTNCHSSCGVPPDGYLITCALP